MDVGFRPSFRLASASIVAVAAVAAVRAGGPAWEARLEAYRARQDVARAGLKEPAEALDARYGTPEVTFAEPRCVTPGETAAITLPGRFAAGSLVVVESDDVKVLSEKLGAKGWEARLSVPPEAPPGAVFATVVAPITNRQAGGPLLKVCARYELALRLASGFALRVAPAGDGHAATWTRPPSSAVLRQAPAELEPGGHGHLDLRLTEDQASAMARMQALMQGEEMRIMQESQQKCDPKAPIETYVACMQGYVAKAEAAKKRRIEAAQQEVPPCGDAGLTLAAGKVTGAFRSCVNDVPEVELEGTYRIAGK